MISSKFLRNGILEMEKLYSNNETPIMSLYEKMVRKFHLITKNESVLPFLQIGLVDQWIED